MRPSSPAPLGLLIVIVIVIVAAALPGCVTEEVRQEEPATPKRFVWPVSVLPSGVYHGVTFHLEVDPERDLSREELEWMRSEGRAGTINVQLPPIIWRQVGRREVYSYKDLHRVEFLNSMFHVGESRYLPRQRASLYIFKQRTGDFAFSYRGQKVVVPTAKTWIPSVYSYAEYDTEPIDDRRRRRRLSREVIQIASAKIEIVPGETTWRVNGRRYDPDPRRPLELHGAAR